MPKCTLTILFCGFYFIAQSQDVKSLTLKLDSLSSIKRTLQFEFDSVYQDFRKKNADLITSLNDVDSQLSIIKIQIDEEKKLTTEVEVLRSEHNYGTIRDGDIIQDTFVLKNIGEHDLLIKDVKVSCGCTVPYWSDIAIKPGESTSIFVTFNSKDKGLKGSIYEYASKITVIANTLPQETYLVLRGFIKK